jgi:hypothetical protein
MRELLRFIVETGAELVIAADYITVLGAWNRIVFAFQEPVLRSTAASCVEVVATRHTI